MSRTTVKKIPRREHSDNNLLRRFAELKRQHNDKLAKRKGIYFGPPLFISEAQEVLQWAR